jgi:hypothetical protein
MELIAMALSEVVSDDEKGRCGIHTGLLECYRLLMDIS